VPSIPDAVNEFLAGKRLAVAGVSRSPQQPANAIYRRLRETGHQVYATNPEAESVEGDPCYPGLEALPERVDGVVIATPPAAATDVVRACAELGIERVWMHRSFGGGSVSEEAVALCREKGISVIVGGCPMMFCGKVDPFHRCMGWFLRVRGRIQV
jgi:predicted CoA-binding protein